MTSTLSLKTPDIIYVIHNGFFYLKGKKGRKGIKQSKRKKGKNRLEESERKGEIEGSTIKRTML